MTSTCVHRRGGKEKKTGTGRVTQTGRRGEGGGGRALLTARRKCNRTRSEPFRLFILVKHGLQSSSRHLFSLSLLFCFFSFLTDKSILNTTREFINTIGSIHHQCNSGPSISLDMFPPLFVGGSRGVEWVGVYAKLACSSATVHSTLTPTAGRGSGGL